MANSPSSKEIDTDNAALAPSESRAVGSEHAPPSTGFSPRSRWVLSSLAGIGLLCLGLLGGMLIGQQMTPPGMHNGNMPNGVYVYEGSNGPNSHVPDELKERIKDHVKEQLQERRDTPPTPGSISPTPSPTAPSDSGMDGSGPPLEGPPDNNG